MGSECSRRKEKAMIAFTADNHLGIESQWGLKERGMDFMDAFESAVVGSMNSGADMIIGGDLFDSAYPPAFAVERVKMILDSARASSGMKFYGIDGNHDPASGKWLKVCGITPLRSDEPVEVDGKKVCGINHMRSQDVLETLSRMADIGVKCDILVLHLALGDLNRMGAASDVAAHEMMPMLKSMGARMVLMGHIHIRQQVDVDGVTFLYPGSTELCSINEPKEKSVEMVDTDTWTTSPAPVLHRHVKSTVVGSEREFAAYEASVESGDKDLHDVYVAPDVADGVKRLRDVAKEKNLLMRVHVIRGNAVEREEEIDRTAGVIGLEQAICKSFPNDSEEAGLVRAILRSPDAIRAVVDGYVKGSPEEDGKGQ